MLFVVVFVVLALLEVIEGQWLMAAAFAALALGALMPVIEVRARGHVDAGLWGPKLTGPRKAVGAAATVAAFAFVGVHAVG